MTNGETAEASRKLSGAQRHVVSWCNTNNIFHHVYENAFEMYKLCKTSHRSRHPTGFLNSVLPASVSRTARLCACIVALQEPARDNLALIDILQSGSSSSGRFIAMHKVSMPGVAIFVHVPTHIQSSFVHSTPLNPKHEYISFFNQKLRTSS